MKMIFSFLFLLTKNRNREDMRKLKKNAKFMLIGLAGITITTASFFMFKNKDEKLYEKINVVEMVNKTADKEVLLTDMTSSINKDIIGYFTFERIPIPILKYYL